MKFLLRILFVVCVLCMHTRPANAQLSYYHDSLRVSILDTTARPAGLAGGVVSTNNVIANNIFANFNVVNAIQLYPSSTQQYLKQVYLVICNCDEMVLKDTLNSYPTIFWGAQPIPKPEELGIGNSTLQRNVRLYPNPASDHITVATAEKLVSVTVRDMSGRIILQQSAAEVNVQALSTGSYFMTVQTTAGSVTETFVKN